MDDDRTIRHVNLIEILSEAAPHVIPPPDCAASEWSEERIRKYFRHAAGSTSEINSHKDSQPSTSYAADSFLSNSADVVQILPYLSSRFSSQTDIESQEFLQWKQEYEDKNAESGIQAGGGVEQRFQSRGQVPPAVKRNQLESTVDGYRHQAISDGIPFRYDGLFPPEDPLLLELGNVQACHPFEKHLAGQISSYELLPRGSWTSGNAAAQNGFDLRLFYKAKSVGEQYGNLLGAARLGERASIGNGFWMSAHGGTVESLLDEATAELGKMEFSPMLATTEANFKIKKPVPLHTSLRIECKIQTIKGIRCWVYGAVKDFDGQVLATCEAQLVDLQQLWAAQAR